MEQQAADCLRIARQCTQSHGVLARARDQHPGHQQTAREHARNTQHERHAASLGEFLCARIQKHDHENEQHHDGASVNDHLHGGHKFRAQQQVLDRQ